jgi:hypothetical protein
MLALEKLPAGQAPAAGTPRWQSMLNPDGSWSTLKPDSQVEEVVRNFFIRQPTLWLAD